MKWKVRFGKLGYSYKEITIEANDYHVEGGFIVFRNHVPGQPHKTVAIYSCKSFIDAVPV